jgi:hypothetical protein
MISVRVMTSGELTPKMMTLIPVAVASPRTRAVPGVAAVIALDPGLAFVVSVAVAGGLEATVGEPPAAVHPVALLGRAVGRLEGTDFGVPRLAGTVYALSVPTGCALAAYAVVALAVRLPIPLVGVLLAGGVLWVASSVRLLVESGRRVVDSSETDLEDAREALLALVGRDASGLSPGLVRSAAVESLAENFSDGFLAPLSAFLALSFVSLPAAAAAAAFLKGANTMDSMFGYPGPFGQTDYHLRVRKGAVEIEGDHSHICRHERSRHESSRLDRTFSAQTRKAARNEVSSDGARWGNYSSLPPAVI